VSYPSTVARCYWVLFEPVKQAHAEPQVPRARRAVLDDGARQIFILTEELASTREHLESTIQAQEATNDDLQAANEEVRSANEELQSTNEELETSKEEIQSSNEELTTVNEELRLRNTDLDRANDDLNNLFGSVQLAVVMVWPDLRIRRFTPLAQKLFNILPTDLGRSICDMNHNIQIENFPHMLSAAMDLQVDREVDVRSRDGSWYLLRIRPYRTEENTIDGATIVLIDITTLAQTQESLRNRVAELAALDRHKNEFLAILAHELRNPVAPLRNAAEVLKLSPADADVSKRARELIDRQVHHLSRLVTDLLDAARAQNGQINLQRKKLDLRVVVQHVAEVQLFQIEAKKQTLQVYLPPDPVWVDGDATRLEQVVSNLLTNANKYTDSVGHIHVTLSTSPSESDASSTSALIEVRDSGEGIDAELMPRLFNLFTQADRSLAHSKGGLGIGLSLVRTLIEMHGGKVRAHSRGRNLGSTFTVSLPLCESDRPAIPVRDFPESELPANGGRVHRVLIVDDNADIRESTQALLSMAGHEAVVASSGEEALALASQIQPSAILLDIGLPDVSGYEVARRLRKKPQLVAVLMIAISGYDTPEARQLAIEAGFDRHLAKPVAFADLQRLLS
jgi:two-component system, chemotaxis family, CheB/CheR fusion protein